MTFVEAKEGLRCSGDVMWFCGIGRANEALELLRLENEALRTELEALRGA